MYLEDWDSSLQVLHTCDNPSCVNPLHLYMGTITDNLNDAYSRDRRGIFNNETYEDMKGLLALGWTQQKVADYFGVTQGAISYQVRKGLGR